MSLPVIMYFMWSGLLAIVLAAADPSVYDDDRDIHYEGTSDNGVDQFQGIAFAEATTGNNRFAPPKPYFPPSGSVVDATKPGPACPQVSIALVPYMSNATDQGEDCLNLRIARPADSSLYTALLPVMVYIYGGGSMVGQAYDRTFNPVGLIQQSVKNDQPVLYVAMNYRLGVFGFAAGEILRTQKAENNGLRDQHLALRWIKDNIKVFGGDPGRVTLAGQSFGGISVALQLVAWGGKQEGVFHKAIVSSGAVPGERTDSHVEENTAAVAESLNCPTSSGLVDEKALACLRSIPLADLLKVNLDVATKWRPPYGFGAFTPVVDGDMLPEPPKALLEQGRFLRSVPVIATWTLDDGSVFVNTSVDNEAQVLDYIAPKVIDYTDDIGNKILSLYPVSAFDVQARAYPKTSPQYFRASRIVRDLYLTCPLLTIAESVSKYGTEDVYVSELNETRLQPYWEAANLPWGISHLSDIPYFFNEVMPPPGDNGERAFELSASYSGSFISFASKGNPVEKGKETFQDWPRANTDGNFGMTALVIGGLHGTGPATTAPRTHSSVSSDHRMSPIWRHGTHKHDQIELRKRSSHFPSSDPRETALQQEDLVRRCKYLTSLRIK